MMEQIIAWAETHVATSPELAYAGAAAIALAALGVAWALARGAIWTARRLINQVTMRAVAQDKSPGFRILLASAGSGRANRFLRRALMEHLERFSFGAPFQLYSAGGLPAGHIRTEQAARARLRRSEADMILWGVRASGRADGLKIHSISRGGGETPEEAARVTITASGASADWGEDFARMLAYQLAKALQPALGRPESFQPERVREIAAVLDALLRSEVAVSSGMRSALEDDFCAAALHIAEAGGDLTFVDAVIERRRALIADTDRQERPVEQTQARLDLGRALLVKASRAFDAGLVQDAMAELDQAVASIRGDLSIRRAQQATDAIARGRSLLETRKRFSLNFNG